MEGLRSILLNTLSNHRETRQNAEAQLKVLQRQAGFAIQLLQLLQNDPRNLAAAVAFKNYVSKHWSLQKQQKLVDLGEGEASSDAENFFISEQDKVSVKQNLVHLMTCTPPDVQRQLSESVRLIAETDFPEQWDGLLGDLVSRMDPLKNDMDVVNGVLETANAIFKRFRYVNDSEEVLIVLKYVLMKFQEPLLILYRGVSDLIHKLMGENKMDVTPLEKLLVAQRTMTRIFYSLNWITIPEYFEDNITAWMEQFHKFLIIPAQGPTESYIRMKYVDEDEEPCPIDKLQLAILENVKLYSEKYEEEFQPFLKTFITDAWKLLVDTPSKPRYDSLAIMGMKFLCSLLIRPFHKPIFSEEGILQNMLERVILPSMILRETDREQFEDNPTEYLQWDIEGAEGDSRRKVACDLVRAACQHFDLQITQLCNGYLQNLLGTFNSNRGKQWPSMDAAITLVIALTVRASTAKDGATRVNDANQINAFFIQYILPELVSINSNPKEVDERPILKADVIKFLATFRGFLARETLKQTLPSLAMLLSSKSRVVHTYAATALEKIFSLYDYPANSVQIYTSGPGNAPIALGSSIPQSRNSQRTLRFNRTDLAVILQHCVVTILETMSKPDYAENEYLMKALLRILVVAESDVKDIALPILDKLKIICIRVCGNPANPAFNHYLFESIAVLIKNVKDVNLIEASLNPVFELVLSKFILEFMPYVFQLMALILELHTQNGIPQSYIAIFQGLLTATLWEHRGNIPGLVRLLEVFLTKGAEQVLGSNGQDLIGALLGIFQKLLSAKATEDESLHLLTSICSSVKLDLYKSYLPAIFRLCFARLEMSKSLRLGRAIILFMSVFAGRHGPNELFQALEQVQPGCSWQILQEIWCKHAPSISGVKERKACIIGMSRVLGEFHPLFDTRKELWCMLFEATSSLVLNLSPTATSTSSIVDDSGDTLIDTFERWAESGHDTEYSRLVFAQATPRDWFPEIANESSFFASQIGALNVSRPNATGSIRQLIQKTFEGSKANITLAIEDILLKHGVRL